MPQCVQSPGPYHPLGPFLRVWRRVRGQHEEGGGGYPGPPYAIASVQRGDIVSAGASGE